MKIAIIGGVAVGATLAAKLRRLNEKVEIEVFEKTGYISYANCGLPYYISKTIDSKDKLVLQQPEGFSKRFNTTVNVNTTVTKVDFKNQIIYSEKNGQSCESSYDKLVIATGTSAVQLPFLKNKDNVFNLKNVEDVEAITEYIKTTDVKDVVILGSGFIGLEASENFAKLKMNTTVVELSEQILAPFDAEIANYGEIELKNNGVNVVTGVGATDYDGKFIYLSNGEKIKADLVLSAVGVKPATTFLNSDEIELDERGFVLVNSKFETSVENVYAAGDIIKPFNKITNVNQPLQLANPANRQAVVLANILNGEDVEYNSVIGVSIINIFNWTLAQAGINEKVAKDKKLNYQVINAHINNHAGYYPGAGQIHFKVLINPKTGEIYGAQAAGGVEGVDKRIDMLAFAIKFNIKIQDLVDLETTYAPQYGSAKDPVLMLGYIGKNIVDGTDELIQYQDLNSEHELLFVLDEAEIGDVSIEVKQNIPLNDLRDNLDKLDKSKHYVVSCRVGARAHNAVCILRNNGFNASNLSGGLLSINNYIDTIEK